MKNRRTLLVALVAFISFVSGGWLIQQEGTADYSARQKARLFQQVLQYVAEYYVDSVDVAQLYDMAIDGMLDQLEDPYTSFLRRQEFGELSISTTGNYGGVGLRIDLRDGWVTVVQPIPDSPSERAGLVSGDQLVEINDRSTKGWSTDDAAEVLRGEPGTDAQVTVVRPGITDSLRFTLTRDQIHVSSVEGVMMLSPTVGYLTLTNVTQESSNEMREAIAQLRDDGARGMVLDLRNNPGGVLNQGVALADLFLERDDVIVETKGRAPGASEVYRASMSELWPDMPVVVLVNRLTASAAEILAGALQDHDRALILGTPTFGKGVAYLLVPLTRTEAVTVTSSRWYTPSGRSIQRDVLNTNSERLMAHIRPDAVTDTSQIFFTDSGREIKAGSGGIQPDIVLAPESLTTKEQEFAQALGSNIPAYRNVLSRYALDLKGEGTVTEPDFEITTAMLDTIQVRLRESGVTVADSVYDGARELIADQFAPELTRYVFGRSAELRRLAIRNNQTQKAIELLERATSPSQLFALAQREPAGAPNDQ